jgi:hypothetical protein
MNVEKWSLTTGECIEKFNESQAAAFSKMKHNSGSLKYTDACKVVKLMDEIYFRDKDKPEIFFLTHENLIILDSTCYGKYKIVIRDFSATDRAIFTEIARLFRTPAHAEARELFSRMPQQAKQEIYRIYQTLTTMPELFDTVEESFLAEVLFTYERQAQAIENYLNPPPSLISRAASAVSSVIFWPFRK